MSLPLHLLFAIHLAATWYLVGLIWTIQAVHYPLFAHIPPDAFDVYEGLHVKWITPVVAPVMLVELFTGALLLAAPSSFLLPHERWLGFALIVLVWVSTFLIQVPLHNRLTIQHSVTTVSSLVVTNWIRTISWTARGLVLFLPLLRILRQGSSVG